MKKYLILYILGIFTFISCNERKEINILFERIESVMDEYPDSAYAMLEDVNRQKYKYSESQRMRYELLKANAQNKAYIDFTTDSLMLQVAKYYDAHGSANEQMEAHYLLGCTYRDLHESPMALSCYLDATEKADTLSADCNYDILMKIWGQIADEFDRQIMPYKELEANAIYKQYAEKIKDTLNYLIGIEMDSRAYYLLGDTTNVLKCIYKAYNIYKEKGLHTNAAISLLKIIPICINRNDTLKAKKIMQDYELEARLINSDSIAKSFTHYYYIKATYYQAINQLDSAEYYYRKALKYGYKYESYDGLLNVFHKQFIVDSVFLYSKKKEEAFNVSFSKLHTQAMFNADGMFNYVRNQRVAMENIIETERSRTKTILLGIVSVISFLFGILFFIRYKSKKNKELKQLMEQQDICKDNYMKALTEHQLLKSDYNTYLSMKRKEIDDLREKYEILSLKNEVVDRENIISSLRDTVAISTLLDKTKIRAGQKRVNITNAEWHAAFEEFKKVLPHFYHSVITNTILGEQEQKIAVLTIFKLRTSEIAYLLNISSPNVSNAKSNINKKLFACESAKGLFDNLLKT